MGEVEREVNELKIGSGFVQHDGPIWVLVEDEDKREAVLARWASGADGLPSYQTLRVRVTLLNGSEDSEWRMVPQALVEQMMDGLLRTPAADRVQAVRQRARERAVAAEGRERDREALEARAEAQTGRYEVPAAAKSFWGASMGEHHPAPTGTALNGLSPDKLILDEYDESAGPLPQPMSRIGQSADVSPVVTDHGEPVPDATPQPEEAVFSFSDDVEAQQDTVAGVRSGAWDAAPREAALSPAAERFLGRMEGQVPPDDLAMLRRSTLFAGYLNAVAAELDVARLLVLAQSLEELGSQMIYEARELRRLAGGTDDDTSEDKTHG